MTETVITVTSAPQQNSQQQRPSDLSWVQCNINYFLTYPGILKLIQLVRQLCGITPQAGVWELVTEQWNKRETAFVIAETPLSDISRVVLRH